MDTLGMSQNVVEHLWRRAAIWEQDSDTRQLVIHRTHSLSVCMGRSEEWGCSRYSLLKRIPLK